MTACLLAYHQRFQKRGSRFGRRAGMGGGAFDPRLGYFIVNTQETGLDRKVGEKEGRYWASANIPTASPTRRFPVMAITVQNPPWGDLWR